MAVLQAAEKVGQLLPQLKSGKAAAAAAELVAERGVALQHLRERKVLVKLAWLACDKVRPCTPARMRASSMQLTGMHDAGCAQASSMPLPLSGVA